MHIFDAHLHIIDPRFRLVPNQGYTPEPFTVDEYRSAAEDLGIVGGAVVAGSFHGFAQDHLVSALQRLGPAFVGVAQLPFTVKDEEIHRLHSAGVRAIRINLRRGPACDPAELTRLAQRIHHLAGWHTEVYADGAQLAEMFECLSGLPRVVIDHLGLTREAAPVLLELLEEDGAFAKVTGFGRLDFDPLPLIRKLLHVNPDALLFGTDLPSTRAPRPFRKADLMQLFEVLEPEHAANVLYKNAVTLYRPSGLHP